MKLPWPMSMRTCIARHGQAAVRATLSSTTREPLLFLYPTWARKSSTAQSPIETPKPNHLPPLTTKRPDDTPGARRVVCADTCKKPSPGRSDSDGALPILKIEVVAPLVRKYNTNILAKGPAAKSSSQRRRRHRDEEGAHMLQQPSERKIRRTLSQAQQAKDHKQRKFAARHDWQARRNEELLRPGDPDWRVILQNLIHSTPQHGKWLTKAITIRVPKSSMLQLLTGLDDNLWSVAHAYDCAVELGPRGDMSEGHQIFVLSGSAVSISKTTAHLLRIVPDMQISRSLKQTQLSNQKNAPPHTSQMEDAHQTFEAISYVVTGEWRESSPPTGQTIPDPPAEWNQLSFYEYVFDLTHTKVPNHLHRFLYKRGRNHREVVMGILRNLFGSQEYKSHLTSMAIKEAVTYFLDMRNVQEARALFNKHPITDPELFNIMLQTPAKYNDLHNFLFILDSMIRKGFAPNRGTWVAFLNANSHNLQIQLAILTAMKQRGLLQHVTSLRDACQVLALSELEVSLADSQPQEEYLKQMDIRFGPDWLSLPTANRILHILGSRGLISRSCDFLQTMESRSIKPDNYSINTMLHHCKVAQDIDGAMEIMKISSLYNRFTPDEETYRILFEMAWRTRSFNLARVIWKYASLSAMVVFRMQNLVRNSLSYQASRTGIDVLSPRVQFMTLAGNYIIGRSRQKITGPLLSHAIPDSDDVAASETVKVLKPNYVSKLMKRELGAFRDWEPSRSFTEKLVEAYEMDDDWKALESDERDKLDPEWMMENGVDVPVRQRKVLFRVNKE